jgi:hypothetical protein
MLNAMTESIPGGQLFVQEAEEFAGKAEIFQALSCFFVWQPINHLGVSQ